MIAETDLVLTRDRKRMVPIGHPDGDSFAWVASKGEVIPDVPGVKQELEQKKRAPTENKMRVKSDDKGKGK